mmetsp:Transcript_40623/g.107645  ORF Transcript_40623/g.107645 Transcript_40623/m.107645 type:complete len:130 (-) Transcript_40623:160-549(-)
MSLVLLPVVSHHRWDFRVVVGLSEFLEHGAEFMDHAMRSLREAFRNARLEHLTIALVEAKGDVLVPRLDQAVLFLSLHQEVVCEGSFLENWKMDDRFDPIWFVPERCWSFVRVLIRGTPHKNGHARDRR